MNKFLRIISTFVVGVGLILLFVYLSLQNSMNKAEILNQPSYYTLQNYWYLLAGGCGCVAFSILSCFLAWNKKMDEKIEILPNAVAAEKAELLGWLSGSSLDTDKKHNSTKSAENGGQRAAKPAVWQKEDEETQTSGDATRTTCDKEDSTVVTGEETIVSVSDEPRTMQEETILEETSSMTVLDTEATILSEEAETTVDDATVIENP